MIYQIKITDNALKQYKKINDPFHTQIKSKIDNLATSGLESGNIKALSGEFKGLYRLRVGNYRIIFDLEEDIITVLSILHRKDVYRK